MQAILLAWMAAATAGAPAAMHAMPREHGRGEDVTVAWRGEDVAPGALAEHAAALGESPSAKVAAWAPFAAEHGYAMRLSDDGRVLYLAPEKRAAEKKEWKLVAETVALFDEVLPPPAAAPVAPQTGAGAEGGRGRGSKSGDGSWSVTWSWGAGPWQRDTETAVLVAARDADDYGAALELLAERHEHLRGWIEQARATAGCTLESPLIAIWLLEGGGLEEYRPENELVHRLATLLVHRRFDHQPAWMLQGLAWHFEDALLDTLYCFPGRSEFVFATEHAGWDKALKSEHADVEALACADVIALERGRFDAGAAQRAFGAARFLAEHRADALPQVLEELRLLREEKGIEHGTDGTWKRIPGYEPSAADVEAVLVKAAGEDVLAEMLAYFRKGKGYRPRR